MVVNKSAAKMGDCEVCPDAINVKLTLEHGNIWMCEKCSTDERTTLERITSLNSVVAESRKIDSTIELKADIYTAKSVQWVEMIGAIQADENIPEADKRYAIANEGLRRLKLLQKVIFDQRADLLEKEHEARMLQVNIQDTASGLRADLREQFKNLDITYKPAGITKTQKSTKPAKASPAPFNKKALYDAATKYGVLAYVNQVRGIMVANNMSAEDAAIKMASMMGLPIVVN